MIAIVDEKYQYVLDELDWRQQPKTGYWHLCRYKSGKCRTVLLHRLLYWLEYGSHPKPIDHANRDKNDNRLENLRPASHSLNHFNKDDRKSKHGRGVCFHPGRPMPYQAKLTVRGKGKSLGYYATAEEAAQAAREYREMVMEFEALKAAL